MSTRPEVYVSGVAESALGEVTDQNELAMVADASLTALAEAGLTLADVDGMFVNYLGEAGSVQLAEYLGIEPRYSDSTDLGGAAFEAHVNHAVAASATGAWAARHRSGSTPPAPARWP